MIVTLPLTLVWFDRVFCARSWRELRTRRWLYLGLALVAIVLAAPTIVPAAGSVVRQLFFGQAAVETAGSADSTVVNVAGVSPLGYLASQPVAWLHYLRLSIWPADQCLDAGWIPMPNPTAKFVGLVAAGLTVALLAGVAFRFPRLGFLTGVPLLVLAPSSSIVPLSDGMAEHRMYLPLAALVTLGVLAADGAIDWLRFRRETSARGFWLWLKPGLLIFIACTLGMMTVVRNAYYSSAVMLFTSVCQQRPDFWRPHVNLSQALLDERKDVAGAEQELSIGIALNSGRAELYRQRGVLRNALRRSDEALADFTMAVQLDPYDPESFYNRALLTVKRGDRLSAIADCRRALTLDPQNPRAQKLLQALLRR